jgi:hypothetical protein
MEPSLQPPQPSQEPQIPPPVDPTPLPPPPPPPVDPTPLPAPPPVNDPAPLSDITAPQQPPASSYNPQPNKLPSAFTLFEPSWKAIKLNFNTFFILWILPLLLILINFVLSFKSGHGEAFSHKPTPASVIITLIVLICYLIIGAPTIVTQIKSAQAQKIRLGEAFQIAKPFYIRLYGLLICVSVIVFIGLLLLIVPGILLLKRYYLAPWIMVNENLGIKASLKRSSEMSKQPNAVWGMLGVEVLLSVFGIIPFLGYIIDILGGVVYSNAPAIRYEQIKALEAGTNNTSPNSTAPAQQPSSFVSA